MKRYQSVPDWLFGEIADALADASEMPDMQTVGVDGMREFLTKRIGARIGVAHNDFRFAKDYRHEVTPQHRLIYALLSTIAANAEADRYAEVTA